MHFPSQNSRFLCNRLDGALKASRRPTVSRSFSVEDFRTTELHRPDARSISIQHGVGFQKLTLIGSLCKSSRRRGNMFGRCPAFQNIPVFRSNEERSYREDRQEARPSRPDVDLIRIELHCF